MRRPRGVRRADGAEGPIDARIAALATRQRGLVTRRQLLELGLGVGAVDHRVRRGVLHPELPGVYRVGHTAPLPLAAEQAALLSIGGDAVLSHWSAAAIHRLTDGTPSPVHVTVASDRRARRGGVAVHRTAVLDARDTRVRQGLQVTSAARTLADVVGELERADAEQLVATALRRGVVTLRELQDALKRAPSGRRGAATLRALLAQPGGPAYTRSRAERLMLALVREAGLAPPRCNARVAPYEADFLWASERLVVEIDSWAHHGPRTSFEADRQKDIDLGARGYEVLRITWRKLTGARLAVAAEVGEALGRRRALARPA